MDMKSEKIICYQTLFHREVIDDLLLGGKLYPPILGRVKTNAKVQSTFYRKNHNDIVAKLIIITLRCVLYCYYTIE